MKKTLLPILSIMLLIGSVSIGFGYSEKEGEELSRSSVNELPQQEQNESLAAFNTMMKVLTHKRCVNCHPAGDRPHQGEDSHVHNFGVRRGPDNHGVAALRCETCHQEENNEFSGVPGAPEWSLAPLSMAWEGLNRIEIAKSIMNPAINGGRSLEETVKHLTEHELVLWAWEPGVDADGTPREKPPVPKEKYIAAVKKWAETGAHIPTE
ncbi:hypothetical protein [Lewinella cohaerens]|uniref:hypothetical protein n=1 Tax=Lewinella cohaerens TaxID=70995 RepID=UPI00037127BA|nr:hypothetical protein [Lewinella cohaerens]